MLSITRSGRVAGRRDPCHGKALTEATGGRGTVTGSLAAWWIKRAGSGEFELARRLGWGWHKSLPRAWENPSFSSRRLLIAR